jgi:molecular chaperone GrpE
MSDPSDLPPGTAPADDTAANSMGTVPGATAAESSPDQSPQNPFAERIAALEAELAQSRDRWLRAEAETQNLRSRTQREVADARNYAIQKFAGDVVEAAQNLRRGIDALPAPRGDEDPLLVKLREGFEGVERSFLGMLERHGIQRQEAQGQPFDPALHQAMAEQPAPEGVAPGTVIQAWTPAWTLNGRLLKPAMVVVAAGGSANASAA